MMRFAAALFAAGVVTGTGASQSPQPSTHTTQAQQASPGKSATIQGATARAFAVFAARTNMSEVELAAVAGERASSAEVKEFAARIIADHRRAQGRLVSMAQENNVTLPLVPDAEHLALKRKLEEMQGDAFDRAYMDAMVRDHLQAVAAFRTEAERGKDPQLQAYASSTLPILEEHLQTAKDIDAGVRKKVR